MSNKERFLVIFNWVKNVVILIPLIVAFTFIFGNVYSKTFVQQIPMAVMDHDNSTTSRSILRQFDDSEGMKIAYYASSDSEVEELLRTKKVSAGLIIPRNFEEDVKQGNAPKTLYMVDMTNLVIGNNAFAYGSEILNTLNAAVQIQVLEGKGMTAFESMKAATSMNFVQRMVYDPQLSYMKYLMFGIFGIMIQQTILEVLAPILIEDKQRLVNLEYKSKEYKKCVRGVLEKTLIIAACSIVGATLCFFVACKYYNLPLKGSILNNYMLLIIFIINMIAICFFLGGFFREALPCVQLCMFLSVPTILSSGYAWPELMLPAGFMDKVNFIWPLASFINPIRAINLKGTGIISILPYIKAGLIHAAIWIPLGIGFYIFRIHADKLLKKRLRELTERAAMEGKSTNPQS